MLEDELGKMGLDIPVVGYLPEDPCFRMESRHLGLVTPQEMDGLKARMKEAGESPCPDGGPGTGERDRREGGTEFRERRRIREIRDHVPVRRKIRLGIARDEAFCFYYKDNLTLLEDLGCILVSFSPLRDSALPDALDGLILGGGYPELHGKELAENKGMLSLCERRWRRGCLSCRVRRIYVSSRETGGPEGTVYSLVGRILGRTYSTGKLVRFGYVQIRNREKEDSCPEEYLSLKGNLSSEGYLLPGETIRGHEFHYWDSTDSGKDCVAVKPDGQRKWNCIHMEGNLFAGYPHLYLPSMRKFAERFVRRCGNWRENRKHCEDKTGE